jgi:sugar (pentulose or hexulose) kinase
VRSRAYSEFTQHYPKPGWVEHDADEISLVTFKVIAYAIREAGIAASAIQAIGITNQRETVVLWGRKTGQPVADAIGWQDRRTARYCDQLKEQGHEEMFRSKTGLVIDPYFSGTKVKWLLDNVSGLRARAERGEIAFGTIGSWLVYRLTGGKVHVTDYSNASRTLLYNIRELRLDVDILALLDIPRAILPEVKPSSYVYGHTDPESFFGTHGIPVAGIGGDQQAALFGQCCYMPGMAKNTYGTGSFVLMNTGTESVMSKERLLTTIARGDRGRAGRVRPGGGDLHHRRRGPVAARRPPDPQVGGRDAGDGARGAAQRGGLLRAGRGRAGRTPLGPLRPRTPHRHHPRDDAQPRRARCAGEHGLPDPRRHRGDAARLWHRAQGAALRRQRVGQQRAHAVSV